MGVSYKTLTVVFFVVCVFLTAILFVYIQSPHRALTQTTPLETALCFFQSTLLGNACVYSLETEDLLGFTPQEDKNIQLSATTGSFAGSVSCFFKELLFNTSCIQSTVVINETKQEEEKDETDKPDLTIHTTTDTDYRELLKEQERLRDELEAQKRAVTNTHTVTERETIRELQPIVQQIADISALTSLTIGKTLTIESLDCSTYAGDGKLTTDENGKIICDNDHTGGTTNTDSQTLSFDDSLYTLSIGNGNTIDLSVLANAATSTLEGLSDVNSFVQSTGDLIYWNGTAWNNIATSSLGLVNDVTGNWTGTFDGQEGSYYLDLTNATGTTDDLTEGSTNLFSQWNTNGLNITYLSGNVGIGTTTPNVKLQITNTDAINSFLVEDNTSPDATPFVITAGGNVGIGTSTPANKLTVIGTGRFTGSVTIDALADGCVEVSSGLLTSTGSNCGVGGGGITSLNGRTASSQSFATSSVGTDFEIISAGSIHTFHLPSASASARGALTSTDWTSFNAKVASTSIDTSAELESLLTDETGSGNVVFSNSPVLVTPSLGTPSALTLTNATGLPIATGISGLGANVATFLATPSSANLASAVTGETGSGALVFGTSPTFGGTVNASALTLSSTFTLSGSGANIALGSNYLSGDGDDEGIYVDGSGNIGIGTTSPGAKLHIFGTSDGSLKVERLNGPNNITLLTHVNNTNDSHFYIQKARGGTGAIAGINAGDDLGTIDWQGYDGTTYTTAASIRADSTTATGDFDASLIYDANLHTFQVGGSDLISLSSSGVDFNNNPLIDVDEIQFVNSEEGDHPTTAGNVGFDENFSSAWGWTGGDGGGLAVYTTGDGWGALLSTSNMEFLDAEFNKVNADICLTSNASCDPTTAYAITGGSFGISNIYSGAAGEIDFQDQVNFNFNSVNGILLGNNLRTNGNWLSGDGGNEGLYVDNAGEVGIGTSDPSNALEIAGLDNANGIRLTGPRPGLRFYETDGSADQNYQIDIQDGTLRIGPNNDSFSTFGSGEIAITQGGHLGIGDADPSVELVVVGSRSSNPIASFDNTNNGVNGDGIDITVGPSSANPESGNYWITFIAGDGGVNGGVRGDGTNGVNYVATSDERLKENIEDVESGLSRVLQLKPRTYNFIGSDVPSTGFIAQELYKVFPEAVSLPEDLHGDPNKDPWMVSYANLTPLLASGIKDMHLELEALLTYGTISASSTFAHLFEENTDTIWSRLVTLAQGFVDGVLTIAGIKTNELCIGKTCVDENQLKALLQNSTKSTNPKTSSKTTTQSKTTTGNEEKASSTPSVDKQTGTTTEQTEEKEERQEENTPQEDESVQEEETEDPTEPIEEFEETEEETTEQTPAPESDDSEADATS